MKKIVYYVIGGPYVSDQAGLNRGPLILNIFIVTLLRRTETDSPNTFIVLL